MFDFQHLLGSTTPFSSRRAAGLLAIAAALLVAMPARAQVTWDATVGTTGPQDGAGTWSTSVSGTNWWDGLTNVAWPNLTTSSAIFGAGSGAAGTVTVSGSVITNAITFNAPGSGTYTLSGGTISLEGTAPTITANVNASIGSVLAGSAGLVKAGNGTLTLSSSNSYTGGTQIDAGVLVGSNRSSFGTSTIAIGASGTAQLTAGATNFYVNGYMNAVTGSGVLRVVGATSTSVNYSGDLSGFTGTVQMEATSANPWVGYGNTSGPSENLTGSNAKFVVSGGVAAQNRGLLTLLPSVSGTVAMGELSGDGAIHAPQNSAAQVVTYEIGALSTSSTFSGAFMDNFQGAKIRLRKVGSGTLTLSGTNNTRPYSGGTQLNGGVLALGSANALSSSGTISFGGGTLQFSSANTTDYSSRFSTAAGQAYSLDTNGEDITIGTALSSSGGTLTKHGLGALTLSTGNGQTDTTVNGGQLNVNHIAALGTPAGTLTMAAGTRLDNTSGGAVAVSNPKSIALGNSLTFVGSNDLDLGGGTTTLSAETTFDIQAGELAFGGDVVGAGFGIIKNGAGTLALGGLTGTNSFTGNSTINAGKLLLEGTSVLGGGSSTVVTLGENGFLEVGASASLGNVTIAGYTQNLITNTPVDANQDFTVSQTLSTANTKFNGVQTIGSGVTVTTTHNYLGTIPTSATPGRIVFENGATLAATENFEIDPNQGVALDSGTAIVSVAAGKRVFFESVVAGSGGLRKIGVGNLRLTSSNSYQGGTVIEQGILGISLGAALGDVSSSLTIDGATLAAATYPDGSGTGATIDAARTVLIGNGKTSGLHAQTGLTLRYDGAIAEVDALGAAGSLQFGFDAVREGTVILGGANTYRGDTILSHGTLKLASGGSLANSPTIVVGDAGSNGAIFDLTEKSSFAIGAGQTLKGKGTVLLGPSTALTINGLLSPGNSPGILTYDGGGTVTLSGTTLMEVWGTSRGANPGYDAIDVLNGTDLTFGGILQLDFNQTFANSTSFNLFTPDGTSSLASTFSSITMVGSSYTDLTFTNNAGLWTTNTGAANASMSFDSATGTLSIIVVPEPVGLALAGLGLAAAAFASRRRRR